jgi:hypothetical protein
MKLDFSRQIFFKRFNTEFYANPSSGVVLFHAEGWTDRRDDANSHSS